MKAYLLAACRNGKLPFLVWLCFLGSASAGAQDKETAKTPAHAVLAKKVTLSLENAPFSTAARLLSKQAGISIVADSNPEAQPATVQVDGTLQEALDVLAEKYAYDWKALKSGVIVMNRRFSKPDALPDVTLPELKRMTRSVLEILNAFPYDTDAENARQRKDFSIRWPKMLAKLANSFTPQQAEALRQGRRLTVKDLYPPQRALLEETIITCCLSETRDKWAGLQAILNTLPDLTLRVELYQSREICALSLRDKGSSLLPANFPFFTSVVTRDAQP